MRTSLGHRPHPTLADRPVHGARSPRADAEVIAAQSIAAPTARPLEPGASAAELRALALRSPVVSTPAQLRVSGLTAPPRCPERGNLPKEAWIVATKRWLMKQVSSVEDVRALADSLGLLAKMPRGDAAHGAYVLLDALAARFGSEAPGLLEAALSCPRGPRPEGAVSVALRPDELPSSLEGPAASALTRLLLSRWLDTPERAETFVRRLGLAGRVALGSAETTVRSGLELARTALGDWRATVLAALATPIEPAPRGPVRVSADALPLPGPSAPRYSTALRRALLEAGIDTPEASLELARRLGVSLRGDGRSAEILVFETLDALRARSTSPEALRAVVAQALAAPIEVRPAPGLPADGPPLPTPANLMDLTTLVGARLPSFSAALELARCLRVEASLDAEIGLEDFVRELVCRVHERNGHDLARTTVALSAVLSS